MICSVFFAHLVRCVLSVEWDLTVHLRPSLLSCLPGFAVTSISVFRPQFVRFSAERLCVDHQKERGSCSVLFSPLSVFLCFFLSDVDIFLSVVRDRGGIDCYVPPLPSAVLNCSLLTRWTDPNSILL